jgi:predicted CoA-binding protein
MQTLSSLQLSSQLAHLLKTAKTIAVVGLSPKASRPSNMVARYLMAAGYIVYPVNPGQDEVLGVRCYPSLGALPSSVDIVDIFRKPEEVMGIVEEALGMKPLPLAIWMQQGIVHHQAGEVALSQGVFVVMDRCIKIDHQNLL